MKIDLDTVCSFTWGFGQKFLLEAPNKDYYVWSDPDYNGDNTIRPYKGNPNDFADIGFCGRDKGIHTIRGYCGPDVKFLEE